MEFCGLVAETHLVGRKLLCFSDKSPKVNGLQMAALPGTM